MATVPNKPVELTAKHVEQIFKTSQSAKWHPIIKEECDKAQINTVLRLAAFLAQLGHESGDLKRFEENLNYSASGLLNTFPKYFKSQSEAEAYARKPEKIANRVYANRMGNGSESSGDGWKHRGRGAIQLTGKQNYIACDRSGLRCINNPDVLASDRGAIASAVWFWKSRSLNEYADRGDFAKTTRIINGGTNGAADREAKYQRNIRILLGVEPDAKIDVQPEKTNDINEEPTSGAKHGSVSEPKIERNSVYPWNFVYESRSGHVFEVDDTPGEERLYIQHRSGSYQSYDRLGSFTIKTILDHHEIIQEDRYTKVGSDWTTVVGSQMFTAAQEIVFKSGGRFDIESADRVQVNSPMVAFTGQVEGGNAHFKYMSSDDVADLTARDALFANEAARLAPGSAGGAAIAGISESVDFGGDGNPRFTKPVTMSQPMKLPVTTTGSLPDAASNKDAMIVDRRSSTPKLMISNGTTWESFAP